MDNHACECHFPDVHRNLAVLIHDAVFFVDIKGCQL